MMTCAEELFWQLAAGLGKPFAPAGKIFKEWLAVPKPDRRRWRELLREGIELVGR